MEKFIPKQVTQEQKARMNELIANLGQDTKDGVAALIEADAGTLDMQVLKGLDQGVLDLYNACMVGVMTDREYEQCQNMVQELGHDTRQLEDLGLGWDPDERGWIIVHYLSCVHSTGRRSLADYLTGTSPERSSKPAP